MIDAIHKARFPELQEQARRKFRNQSVTKSVERVESVTNAPKRDRADYMRNYRSKAKEAS